MAVRLPRHSSRAAPGAGTANPAKSVYRSRVENPLPARRVRWRLMRRLSSPPKGMRVAT